MNLSFDITLATVLAAVGALGVVVGRGSDASSWVIFGFAVLALLSLGWLLGAWLRYRRV
jgi:hypothetical protein